MASTARGTSIVAIPLDVAGQTGRRTPPKVSGIERVRGLGLRRGVSALLLVQSDAGWCRMVQRKKKAAPPTTKRFSVTLDILDYEALVALGEKHKPPLKLQYLVSFAVQQLLRDARDPQLVIKMGDPLARGYRDS